VAVRSRAPESVVQCTDQLLLDCKKLAPVWEELADSFASAKDKVTIAKVDADGLSLPVSRQLIARLTAHRAQVTGPEVRRPGIPDTQILRREIEHAHRLRLQA
jgi:hypothetical protein